MKNKLFAWAIAWTMVVVINAHAGRFDLHFPNPKSSGSTIVGGVYTMDNAPDGNKVWAFGRRADGSLTAPRKYSTGGAGSGDGLGNQGGVLADPDSQRELRFYGEHPQRFD